jgi:hypothetical protein
MSLGIFLWRRYRDLGKTPLKCDVVAGKNEFSIELVK